MPRLGFLSIFSGGGGRGEGVVSSGVCSDQGGRGASSTHNPHPPPHSPLPKILSPRPRHWSPPRPRPLSRGSDINELPKSLTASGSWDETEPPSPVLFLPTCSPPDTRPATDGELDNGVIQRADRRRRSSRDVIREAVTKILEDKKTSRERSVRERGRGREGFGGRPPAYPRRRDRRRQDVVTDTDDDSGEFTAYIRQRHQWRDHMRMVERRSEDTSHSSVFTQDSMPSSPRPTVARRASNFLLKSFRAVSSSIRLTKKYVPTYYLTGADELPEPEQLLDKFGHSLDSKLEERRSSIPEQKSLCVVWNLSPEDTGQRRSFEKEDKCHTPAPEDSVSDLSRAGDSSSDVSRVGGQSSDTPIHTPRPWLTNTGKVEHIYEDVCYSNTDTESHLGRELGSDESEGCVGVGSDGMQGRELKQHHLRIPQLARVAHTSTLLTLPENMLERSDSGAGCQSRKDSPYPKRCRGFRSMPCSPLCRSPHPAMPHPADLYPPLHSPVPLLSPHRPHSPTPYLFSRPQSPRVSVCHPNKHVSELKVTLSDPTPSPRSPITPSQSKIPKIQVTPGNHVERPRNIALRRKGTKISPLTIDLSKAMQEEEGAKANTPTLGSPIYAQPYASSPGPVVRTPSYTTPFRHMYSLTPTLPLSPEPVRPQQQQEQNNSDAALNHNVFFGQDFLNNFRAHSPPARGHGQGGDRHRDSAYFSTDESTENVPPAEHYQHPLPTPPSTILLRQAIEHSLVDSLQRLPEMVASEVSRQVRQCLQTSTSEIAAELHKRTGLVARETSTSCSSLVRSTSESRRLMREDDEWYDTPQDTHPGTRLGPKRPSTLDLMSLKKKKHTYSYSCQDLLGDDLVPPGFHSSRRSSRVSAAVSFADLDSITEQTVVGFMGHWDQTTSVPSHLQHLHHGDITYDHPELEVEGHVMELPYKHSQHLKEALTPLCRELSQSLLLEEPDSDSGSGGNRSKNVTLKLKVNLEQQMDGDQSDTSMEWDYFDQRNNGERVKWR
ncbi:hypothetical protein Pmani_013448 [Petrolisthes manimaculis]|uniref:Uncharacterized protein n=1 Tax=Petrolisthes manimaculis TaxID=1843537 RepID=A0AAE1PYI7_9EUCA|nr:hypothetical protein Pmani_013448 [Petrolisthes manimaculis]